ncbi:MAG: septal ring lytic transglycosylase RlpA family protein [Candidatus Aminicenantes bacterium]|nr:septal ring lytic transglycosylase RlpA family protein [Candidatus Aminicenantes bacterium]
MMKTNALLAPLAAALILCLGAAGCRSVKTEISAPAKMEPSPPAEVGPAPPFQEGIASWYGPGFHGKKTSNKETYNMYDMTAAHQTLPFETHVRVTNLSNSRSVIVRINDRGPFVKDRIIDLSFAAAQALDMHNTGTAPVRLEILLDRSPPLSSLKFSVQVGSFTTEANALALKDELKTGYQDVYVKKFQTSHKIYFRVRIKAETREAAQKLALRLQAAGYTAIVLEEQ